MVGSNVIKVALQRYQAEVIASLYGTAPDKTDGFTLDPLDLRNHEAVLASLRKFKPDVVIHSAALMDFTAMYANRPLAWSIFVDSTRVLARACREIGARFIYVSSDWVFDGREALVDEDTPPMPVNYYGIMKVAAENSLISMDGLNYAIARTAAVYGFNYVMPKMTRFTQTVGLGDMVNYYVDRLTKGQLCEVWTGERVNDMSHPTLATDAADLFMRLAQRSETGIFHCFGSEPARRLELAHHVADVFRADHSLIAAVPTDPEVVAQHANIPIPFRCRASTEKTAKVVGRRGHNVLEGLSAYKTGWEAFYHGVPLNMI